MANEAKNYDFEANIAKEEETKVQNEAVTRAKQKMAEEQLERDTRQVQRRLEDAENQTKQAEREGRFDSKKKNILKKYSEGLQAAKTQFEADGDWKKYDDTAKKLVNEKEENLEKAKREVYGDDAWRY